MEEQSLSLHGISLKQNKIKLCFTSSSGSAIRILHYLDAKSQTLPVQKGIKE